MADAAAAAAAAEGGRALPRCVSHDTGRSGGHAMGAAAHAAAAEAVRARMEGFRPREPPAGALVDERKRGRGCVCVHAAAAAHT
jgi:hypothetical protein